jgi:hypothetical protein
MVPQGRRVYYCLMWKPKFNNLCMMMMMMMMMTIIIIIYIILKKRLGAELYFIMIFIEEFLNFGV